MTKKLIICLLIGFIGFFIGVYYLVQKDNSTQVFFTSYKVEDKEKPRVEVKQTSQDLGQMKVSDEKYKDFLVKNVGTRGLILSNISSSCGCTLGQLIYEGEKSPEFGMHSKSAYAKEIPPGKEASIRVIYRPYIMPVYGLVDREVYVETNDPQNSKLIFRVTANIK